VPKFCRHNRLLQNCPICAREQAVELRPLISGGSPRAGGRERRASAGRASGGRSGAPAPGRLRERGGGAPGRSREPGAGATARSGGRAGGLRVRRLARQPDDGYRSALAPGLRASADAERLATELALSAARLRALAQRPPGLYAEVADPGGDLEERTWLAFLIAYLGPLEQEDPFAAIAGARTSWASGRLPDLDGAAIGPRGAHEPGRGNRTLAAYRSWAARAGSQAQALRGEPLWSGERRFERAFERLALPGMSRDARFELLVSLGALGLYELRPGMLALGGGDDVTLAAKRILGIGETLLLERRAAALAEACEVPLGAVDLALYNWQRPPEQRATGGLGAALAADERELARIRAALGL
jgi:hypothetical protein